MFQTILWPCSTFHHWQHCQCSQHRAFLRLLINWWGPWPLILHQWSGLYQATSLMVRIAPSSFDKSMLPSSGASVSGNPTHTLWPMPIPDLESSSQFYGKILAWSKCVSFYRFVTLPKKNIIEKKNLGRKSRKIMGAARRRVNALFHPGATVTWLKSSHSGCYY